MVSKSKKKSQELPSGWIEHINVKNGKTTKYFTNVETGQKFGSWKSLNRYLNSKGGISENRIPSVVSTDSGRSDYSTSSLMEEYPEWLPQGWTVETRRRVGSKHGSVYKVYVEISTGYKLYSKPRVLQYLKKVHHDSSTGNENNEVNEHSTGKFTMSEQSESVEDKCHESGEKNEPKLTMSEPSESVEGKCDVSGEKNGPSNPALEDKRNINESDELPPGWIKEMRSRKYKGGTKKDPYYTDPVSGYVFRSRLDVFRYLKTGDIRECATKPQKRDANESPSPANVKKKENSASTSQLSAADMADKESEISKEKEADCPPFDSPFRASAVVVEEEPGYVEALESHKSEEHSLTKEEGFKQESKLVDDNGVSSPVVTAPSRNSKRKSTNVPQRSSKRLSGHTRDVNEPTLSAAVKEETSKSSSLSFKAVINGETQQLDTNLETAGTTTYTEASPDSNVKKATIVVTDTAALFNDVSVNEVPPQQLDSNIYTESSNAAVSEVPPQQLDTNIYTKSSNAAVREVPPQKVDTNIYAESSNAPVNEVPPQQLDTNIYTESSNAAVNEVPPQQLDTNIYTKSSNAAVREVPPQKLDTNIYTESSNAAVNEVSPQQLDTNIYTESSNAAAYEVPPQQIDTNVYTEASVDRNLHAATESGDKQSPVAINAAVSELPQGFVTNFDATGTSAAAAASASASQSRIEMDLNSTLELLFEDMDVQQQQQETSLGQGNEATQKGDYWSDPCFDFAFKTLAGEMPFDDETMELDSCFQQNAESSSYTQGQGDGVGFVVPDMNAPPSFFQNNAANKSDQVPPGGISMNQLPENPTSQSVKGSLPNCSASDSQPP